MNTQPILEDLEYIRQYGKVSTRYVGLVGRGNLGDEILAKVIYSHFNHRLRLYSPMQMGPLMPYAEKLLGYKAYFLGGGTLIKQVSEHLKRIRKLQAKYPNSKFIVFGTGVGDIAMWERFGIKTNIQPWKEILNRSDFLGVRGPISKQYLDSWDLDKPVKVIGDGAILLARNYITPKKINRSIGLNLGSLLIRDGKFHGGDEKAVYNFYIKLLHYLKSENFKVTFFPMKAVEVEKITLIAREADLSEFQIYPAFKKPIEDTIANLEAQDIFIGERLHSSIFATCAYTPTIMLEYRTKCLDFMASIHCEDWNIRTDKLELDTVVGHIKYFHNNMEKHQRLLFSEMQDKVKTLHTARTEVINIITNA
ncbi:polysaccharide pyruvyl transferase family protein [Leptothoe spongobia]|uniref:Polysaccharide pyruvyl transferase family protein n=1 Tax=Leptothoe spongobia TAU-MAC 1115 TaxID=1967444 RepID=A0A947DCT6_9CYAN|nr:polysaccharide pyruvyl transferase family protein [Leptothoe spongobia]MBT9314750.1 polysaccharide pyruvyl transferase family protein [Leptothoe spongobia TAU-MAC 1115]